MKKQYSVRIRSLISGEVVELRFVSYRQFFKQLISSAKRLAMMAGKDLQHMSGSDSCMCYWDITIDTWVPR